MPPPSTPAPSRTAAIRVAVVEDDAACRASVVQAVQAAPDMRLAWQAAARAPALALLPDTPLDVLLVDLGLPDGSGLAVIAAARQQWPDCAVMVSTIFGDETHVLRSIEAGAMGYLLKDLDAPALLEEVRSLHAGGSPINPMVARKLLLRTAGGDTPAGPTAPAAPAGALSAREAEVLRLVARGHTLEEVAQALGVSRHTVRSFVRRIYDKLQVGTRAEAVRAAARQGWLDE
ncbi:response regulator transcription factor [Ottowia sp.]|uniref:response regulator transcription factor n=1 Tax=Ottowia sp. TaxID=1898956 RepID=UPI0025ECA490|nr:response regulator transcription factor [Ottowia sp.]